MLNKKDNLIIFTLCLIVISLGILIIFKNSADTKIVENTNINVNQNQNINKNINTNQQILQTDKFYEINNLLISEIINNTNKYFDDLNYMKIKKIEPVNTSMPISISEKKIPNIKITFIGNIILEGEYNYHKNSYFSDMVCFKILNESSVVKIPKIKNSYNNKGIHFCFENQEYSKKIFGPEGNFGNATIEIDKYIFSYYPAGVINYATLVKVIKK